MDGLRKDTHVFQPHDWVVYEKPLISAGYKRKIEEVYRRKIKNISAEIAGNFTIFFRYTEKKGTRIVHGDTSSIYWHGDNNYVLRRKISLNTVYFTEIHAIINQKFIIFLVSPWIIRVSFFPRKKAENSHLSIISLQQRFQLSCHDSSGFFLVYLTVHTPLAVKKLPLKNVENYCTEKLSLVNSRISGLTIMEVVSLVCLVLLKQSRYNKTFGSGSRSAQTRKQELPCREFWLMLQAFTDVGKQANTDKNFDCARTSLWLIKIYCIMLKPV